MNHMQNINIPEIKTNLLSGLTVALAMVPEAIAFALIGHVSPLPGLQIILPSWPSITSQTNIKKQVKKLHLVHLSAECIEILDTAKDMVEINLLEDPKYHIADDKLS
jgi:hypothetical protein